MINYFINIWLWTNWLLKQVSPNIWKFLLSLIALLLCINWFLNVNKIRSIKYGCGYKCIYSRKPIKQKLDIDFNFVDGFLVEHNDTIPSFCVIDVESSYADLGLNGSSVPFDYWGNIQSIINDDSVYLHLHHDKTFASVLYIDIKADLSKMRAQGHEIIYDGDKSILVVDHNDARMNMSHISFIDAVQGLREQLMVYVNGSVFGYPDIFYLGARDVSQKVYRLSGIDICRHFTDVRRIRFNFGGPTTFSPMTPVPDAVTMSGFEFTDSLKVEEIKHNGLVFHARFLQLENIQNVRVFVLTTLISVFFTMSVTFAFKSITELFSRFIKYKK